MILLLLGPTICVMSDDQADARPLPAPEDHMESSDPDGYVTRYRLSPQPYRVPRVVGDRPAKEDALGFLAYSRALCDLIVSPRTETPLTIGVVGSWGSGKSTLVGFLSRELAAPRPQSPGAGTAEAPLIIHVVSFDAWHHEAAEVVFPSLARRILGAIPLGVCARIRMLRLRVVRRLKRAWRLSFLDLALRGVLLLSFTLAVVAAVSRFGVGFLPASMTALGVWGFLGILRDLWSAPALRWAGSFARTGEYGEIPLDFAEIQADLGVVNERLTERRERAVLLVDDVDRCSPAKAVATLQAINLLSQHGSFVTLVAFDATVLTRLIDEHFSFANAGDGWGAAFLDKVVHVPFYLPTPSISGVEGFLSSLVAPGSVHTDTVVDQPKPLPNAAPLSDEEVLRAEVEAWQSLAIHLRPNPRHLNRLMNVYRITVALARQESSWKVAARPEMTIAWLIVCAQWPRAAAWLLRCLSPFGTEKHRDIQETLKGDPFERLLKVLQSKGEAEAFGLERLQDEGALQDLLRRENCSPKSGDLQELRRFTIAFSPEVLSALEQPWSYLPPPIVSEWSNGPQGDKGRPR